MALYNSYQLIGGTEKWTVCHSTENLEEIKPTFITALSCDTLIAKDSTKEMLEGAKYLGPMYFDLDSKDIEEAIDGAKALWVRLKEFGVTETDVQIFLSGKKGLHFLIPPQVFMEKVVAVNRLPAIYKEIAFNLAVDTLDFSVYSARKGRMFRTTYNIRDNGNYKVQVTAAELEDLTAESYDALCKTPRPLTPPKPVFRARLAILYEGIRQRVSSIRRKASKPVDAATLRQHLPTIKRLMQGDRVKDGAGFNKIAIQLAIYAHEAKVDEDALIAQCAGLIENHTGDSYRYGSTFKKEEELRRMYQYLEDNPAYEYAIGPIESLLTFDEASGEGPDEGPDDTTGGITAENGHYYADSEQGRKHISDIVFHNITVIRDIETDDVSIISAEARRGRAPEGTTYKVSNYERDSFVSSSALHRALALKGGSFTGNDTQARYIYNAMLRDTKDGSKRIYGTTCEGIDVLAAPMSEIVEARDLFVIWVDEEGVKLPPHIKDTGLDLRFAPDPGPDGVMKTDLSKAPGIIKWLSEGRNRECFKSMLDGLLQCQEPSSLSTMIGWMTASFFTQFFRKGYMKFPLLHVAGPAGTGKTEMLETLMRLFYYQAEPMTQNAASSIFSITSTLAASASIPLMLDEYKPHEMSVQKSQDLRSMFRSSYNGQSTARGGGNRNNSSFRALSSIKLSGPLIFVAESMETEVAVAHRSVVVSLKRPPGIVSMRTKPKWDLLKANRRALSILGSTVASTIVKYYSMDSFKEEFETIFQSAMYRFMPQPDDSLELPPEILKIKAGANERVVFNYAVAEYGLHIFKSVVMQADAEIYLEFEPLFNLLISSVYEDMEKVVAVSMPEFAKVLVAMSDMSRFPQHHVCRLIDGVDYEIVKIEGTDFLSIIGRLAYNKYRVHCRTIGTVPLYMNDASFSQGLRDSPVYYRTAAGTKTVRQEAMVLDYEYLQRIGVPQFT